VGSCLLSILFAIYIIWFLGVSVYNIILNPASARRTKGYRTFRFSGSVWLQQNRTKANQHLKYRNIIADEEGGMTKRKSVIQ
jgi:hypothetical protein